MDDIAESLYRLDKPDEAVKYKMKADELRQKLAEEAKSSECIITPCILE